jgi:hypothetical protein
MKKETMIKELERQNEIMNSLTIDDYDKLRKRWDKEDDLLNSRTNTFLTVNAILISAAQLSIVFSKAKFEYGIATFGIIISILWFLTARRTKNCLNILAKFCYKISPKSIQYALDYKSPKMILPNKIIASILPVVIIFFWIVFILFQLLCDLQVVRI